MALLSNINDKFAVDSTGAIQFNGQVGTSGYVLKSNANAAPTWVDPSTVIGGPYLPLSGGTLTGALAGTSATFSGNVTASAFLTSNGSLTQNGFWGTTINAGSGSNADFALLNSATAGIMYNPTGTLNMVFQGNVGIGETSPATKLDVKGTNNGDTVRISNTGTYGGTIAFTQGSGDTNIGYVGSLRALEGNGSGDNGVGLYSRNRISFYTNSASPDVTISDNGNVGIGVINPTSKLTLPQEEENGFKIEFTGGSYSSGISTVDQSGSGLYIGANSYVNNGGSITYKDSALDSSGIYFDAWNTNSMKFYTALAGTPQQRMSIAGDGAVVINGTTNQIGNVGVGGSTLATSTLQVFGTGFSYWKIGSNATYAYTGHQYWNGITGQATSSAYYSIGSIGDSSNAMLCIRTLAHSQAVILVSRGYGQSNVARFQVLSSTVNPNGGYANIKGVRINAGGLVDIKLEWASGPIVSVEVAAYGVGFTFATTLAISVGNTGVYPYNVLQTLDFPSDAGSAMVAGQLRVTGNIVNPGTWGTTTGSAANMHVDSNGTFFRSTSSLKYKKEVRDYDKGLNEVMQLQPKYYKGKDDGDIQFAGLIAEDVHALGLNEFVQYAEDDTPDALAYPNMIALLTKAIQELEARVKELENK